MTHVTTTRELLLQDAADIQVLQEIERLRKQ